MSTESTKKVVWITVAVSAFVIVVAIAGVLFYPRNQAPAAPATVGNTAAPRPLDPQDYLNAPATSPTETKRNSDVIVIYGDKPQSVPPLGADNGQGTSDQSLLTTTTTTTTTTAPLSAGNDGSQPQATAPLSAAPATAAPAPAATAPATSPKTLAPAPSKPVATSKPAAKAVTTTTTTTKTVAAKPSTKPAAQVTQYWIQAASFTERGKADNLRETLASKGIAALIAVKDINGQSWYRVRVGPYSTTKEATGWLSKVKLVRGCDEAFVSSETPPKP